MVDATIKLAIYNEALSEFLGERVLSSLTEDRKPRRVLDKIWDRGVMDYCLESGNWNFAMLTVMGTYDPTLEPDFGFTYVFGKPSDWLRTCAISQDENFTAPLERFVDEAGYWYCDLQNIYVKYVSKDDSYGYDLSRWTQKFRTYVAAYIALKACKPITGDKTDVEQLEKQVKKALYSAKAHDALGEAAVRPPQGSWTRARLGGKSRLYRTTNGYTGA